MEDGMGEAYGTNGVEEKVLVGRRKRNMYEERSIDIRIILKWILTH